MSNKNWRSHCQNHVDEHDIKHIVNYDPKAKDLFPLLIPKFLKNKIDFKNNNDPILLQVIPQKNEHLHFDGYSNDPVGDLRASHAKGVIHKYHGRVLLITNGACAVNCRYCFRRNFPYAKNYASSHNWQKAIEYIRSHTEIHEVILSGGDPLMLSTKTLKNLSSQLESITHVKTIRIHTRMPLVSPERITDNFIQWLEEISLKKVMVLHCNHAQELDNSLRQTIKLIAKTGTLLLNQSVLLKNINDKSQILADLSHRLFEFGILPYYLNQLDKANGTQHFSITNTRAKSIHKQLLQSLPGYLVPKLVEEISGKKHKSPIF
ncbi:MAG: EF-P beta-lysylation protein EpmB [Alcanivoracaceae bacterium]|nr:EF-P beta-lysylation protein EpmB [Alcanivoracaceae bacterium]